jgi:2-polyprenyl-6-methoxyphenol hydroxylase-like FAD-dependent oxidoreductase
MTNQNSRSISRRKAIAIAGAGAAGLTTAIATAQANTQNPPVPETQTNPEGRFANKVVLITRATSGIGEATARAFAREGAIVHFCGRRINTIEEMARAVMFGVAE